MVGLVIGLAAAATLARFLESLLYEIRPTDPTTYAAMAALLLAVAVLASYLAARRAAAVDPASGLRAE